MINLRLTRRFSINETAKFRTSANGIASGVAFVESGQFNNKNHCVACKRDLF